MISGKDEQPVLRFQCDSFPVSASTSVREVAWFALLSLVSALAFCWPLVWTGGMELLDGCTFVTAHFWQAEWVWDQWLAGRWPAEETALLTWPLPLTMRLIGWPLIVLGFPLRLLVPSVLAFNIAFILLFSLGPTVAFVLFRRLFTATLPAAGAALIFGYSPYVLATIHNGHIYSMFICWIPLTVLFAHRALALGSWRDLLLLGLSASTAMVDNPYHGMIAGSWVMLFVVAHLLPALSRPRVVRASLVTVVLMAGMALPVPYYRVQLTNDTTGLTPIAVADPGAACGPALARQLGAEEANSVEAGATEYMATIDGLLRPLTLAEKRAPEGCVPRHVNYLGIALLLLAAASFVGLRSRGQWLVLVATGLFLLFAAGPAMHWNGVRVCLEGRVVWLPYKVLTTALPFLGKMGGLYRWAMAAQLGLVILAVVGLDRVVGRWRPARRTLVAVAVLGLIMLELLCLSPAPPLTRTASVAPPPCMSWLRSQTGGGAVFDLDLASFGPLQGQPCQLSYLRQLQHRRPLLPQRLMDLLLVEAAQSRLQADRQLTRLLIMTGTIPVEPDPTPLGAKPDRPLHSLLRQLLGLPSGRELLSYLGVSWATMHSASEYAADNPVHAPIAASLGAPVCQCRDSSGFLTVYAIPQADHLEPPSRPSR